MLPRAAPKLPLWNLLAGAFARAARADENDIRPQPDASGAVPARFGACDAKSGPRLNAAGQLGAAAVNVGAHVVQLLGLLLKREVH